MLVVATAYIYIGSKSAAKIRALRIKAYPKEVIKDKFNSFDTNKSGSLSFKEFYNLLNSLDVDIDYRDAEMIFVRIDKSLGDGISFEEFKAFWNDSDEIP
jgi:Ca2+-binding EF-hand superfamily protein